MQNDADHNVTRMNLGQAARQQSSTKRPAVQVAATCGVDLKPLATFIAPIRRSWVWIMGLTRHCDLGGFWGWV